MRTIHLEDAVARSPEDTSLPIRSFMAVGTPECLIDELVRRQQRHLTVNANDTTSPGKHIGTLMSARVTDRVIADQRQIQSSPARLYVSQQTDLIWWSQR